jgi:hypothetical protein
MPDGLSNRIEELSHFTLAGLRMPIASFKRSAHPLAVFYPLVTKGFYI